VAKPGPRPAPNETKRQNGVRSSRINDKAPGFALDNNAVPPKFLSAAAKEEWRRVWPELSNCKVLAKTDRQMLTGYCVAFADFLQADKELKKRKSWVVSTNGAPQQAPEISIRRRALEQMLKFAAELGMTPSARGRVGAITGNAAQDPAEALMFGDDGHAPERS